MRLEFSGCPPFRAVLRDVACVVQFWRTSENARLQSIITFFRFVASFAVLETCVRGEHVKFVSGEAPTID